MPQGFAGLAEYNTTLGLIREALLMFERWDLWDGMR